MALISGLSLSARTDRLFQHLRSRDLAAGDQRRQADPIEFVVPAKPPMLTSARDPPGPLRDRVDQSAPAAPTFTPEVSAMMRESTLRSATPGAEAGGLHRKPGRGPRPRSRMSSAPRRAAARSSAHRCPIAADASPAPMNSPTWRRNRLRGAPGAAAWPKAGQSSCASATPSRAMDRLSIDHFEDFLSYRKELYASPRTIW